VRDLLTTVEAAHVLHHRFAKMNIRQPLKGPVQGTPLAVCDARTVAPQELVGPDVRSSGRTGGRPAPGEHQDAAFVELRSVTPPSA
jgi:hypothetical protein